ncbi:hypothetical protein PVAND_014843 [Polypedilum vanderplanki]|uniref:Uncharacterized protein n=1 Tax=Polypedilum vanderplanki TaxID=319348 RepID=A0A9J6BAD7_POLVA|nr:hypothetical protein PVAND_014843 [Polypedilum vanderplanki]
MKLIGSFLLFLPFISAKRTYNSLPEQGRFRFKLFKCEPTQLCLETVAYPNYTCYAKAVSRTVSTVSGYFLLRKPIYEGYVSGEILYKYGTIYRQVIKIPEFNFCEFISLSKNSILLRQLYIIAETAAPGFVHECPYTVFEDYNILFPSHVLFSLFPQGDYKAILNFNLGKDGPFMGIITLIGTAESHVKETFG